MKEEPKKDAAVEESDAQIHDRVHSTKSVQTKVTYVEDPNYPDGFDLNKKWLVRKGAMFEIRNYVTVCGVRYTYTDKIKNRT